MEEVLPKIGEVQPAEIKAGSEVTVIASGGYLKDNCGGFIEGARDYKLYFDDEPIADLSCYVNHCEAKFELPTSVGEPAPQTALPFEPDWSEQVRMPGVYRATRATASVRQ